MEETILEGHLGVTKELLAFQTPEKKFCIGCEKGGANLIKVSSIMTLQYYMFYQCQINDLFIFEYLYI